MGNGNLDTTVAIRRLQTVEELTLVQELEKIIWAEDSAIPIHQTVTAVKNGGMVLGAFADERLIGFQYSFAGFDGKRAYLCSHALGIHPDYRIGGIGEKLKWAQREEALNIGYDLITWTYDPLETVNGNLNIRKLGAICSHYIENCYGEMKDILNGGIPSDRFLVKWWITSDRVERRVNRVEVSADEERSFDIPALIDVEVNQQGKPVPFARDVIPDASVERLLVPVPAAFQKIKEQDLALARSWRMVTRSVCTQYFQSGWQVADFIKTTGHVHYYVLQKQ